MCVCMNQCKLPGFDVAGSQPWQTESQSFLLWKNRPGSFQLCKLSCYMSAAVFAFFLSNLDAAVLTPYFFDNLCMYIYIYIFIYIYICMYVCMYPLYLSVAISALSVCVYMFCTFFESTEATEEWACQKESAVPMSYMRRRSTVA